jgi:hypothetical protein
MPGVTPSCLEESYLIRNKEELLKKTLFVLPPSECYIPPLGKRVSLGERFDEFRHRMLQVHRDMIGLHFPDDDGFFAIMDFKTGKVLKSRPWKIVEWTTHYKSHRQDSIERFQSLDEFDIRAAVNMVLHARGFI